MNQTTIPKEKPETVVTTDTPAGTWTLTGYGIFALILAGLSLAFGIAFQIGAGMLSYAKYQSIGWAILDTIFAVFYYPYYAIFLNRSAPEVTPTTEGLMGGKGKPKGKFNKFSGLYDNVKRNKTYKRRLVW